MDTGEVNNAATIVPQFISILACLYLFFNYATSPDRTPGLKMIFILSLSDFIFHVTLLSLNIEMSSGLEEAVKVVFNTALRFSAFWTCSMAFLVYKSMAGGINRSRQEYINITLIPIFLFSFISSTVCCFLSGINLYIIFVTTMIAPLLLSVILTTVFYLKSIKILSGITATIKALEGHTINLYLYAFVQLTTLLPALTYSFFHILYHYDNYTIDTITRIPLGLAGFANALIYFFKRMSPRSTPNTNLQEVLVEEDSFDSREDAKSEQDELERARASTVPV